MSAISRRQLLRDSAAVTLGYLGLRTFLSETAHAQSVANPRTTGFGDLIRDPNRVMDLPDGFSYQILSRTGETMDDGLLVPGNHDGMAALPGPDGLTILVRNHELEPSHTSMSPFGRRAELLERVDQGRIYDAGKGTRPTISLGGTTTLVYDTKASKLQSHFLSLAGTNRNCAGGPTPWGSWLTCEENTQRPTTTISQDHGYIFEVPATAAPALAAPVPLKAMGRFNHEAVAVDPRTGIVYETEDRDNSLFYRFIPEAPGQLIAGGRLQALKIRDMEKADTTNWSSRSRIPVGQAMDVEWIDLDEVEAPRDDLRTRGYAQGAARFARGEGIAAGVNSFFIACTSGGRSQVGQIWRYTPSPMEGRPEEREQPGKLELFIEPNNSAILKNADNVTVAPWGDLIICEDGSGNDSLVGVTPAGRIYRLARNSANDSELAGITFSPDGSTLFVNVYSPGMTLAIRGPWESLGRAAGDVNGDGRLDLEDVHAALRIAMGMEEATAQQLAVGDTDRNGRIDLMDVRRALRELLGLYR